MFVALFNLNIYVYIFIETRQWIHGVHFTIFTTFLYFWKFPCRNFFKRTKKSRKEEKKMSHKRPRSLYKAMLSISTCKTICCVCVKVVLRCVLVKQKVGKCVNKHVCVSLYLYIILYVEWYDCVCTQKECMCAKEYMNVTDCRHFMPKWMNVNIINMAGGTWVA